MKYKIEWRHVFALAVAIAIALVHSGEPFAFAGTLRNVFDVVAPFALIGVLIVEVMRFIERRETREAERKMRVRMLGMVDPNAGTALSRKLHRERRQAVPLASEISDGTDDAVTQHSVVVH